jgi:hypothetical protein
MFFPELDGILYPTFGVCADATGSPFVNQVI